MRGERGTGPNGGLRRRYDLPFDAELLSTVPGCGRALVAIAAERVSVSGKLNAATPGSGAWLWARKRMAELGDMKADIKAMRAALSDAISNDHKASFGRCFVAVAQNRLNASLFAELVKEADERLESMQRVAASRGSGSAIEPKATGTAASRSRRGVA